METSKGIKGALEMKLVLVGLAVICLAGCSQQPNMHSNDALKTKVANLEKQVNESEPGVGEIMGVIQMHHTKLYYAGTNANWTLAKYELSEIQENLNEVMDLYPKKFKQVRVPLPELIPSMTKASMDQVQEAIQQKNEKSFVKAYKDLSTSCSNCHAAANNPFINIQVPAKGMYTDQQFKP